MTRRPEVLLLLLSLLFCVLILELVFCSWQEEQKTYPAVYYHTEDERVKIMGYDDGFSSSADHDLRRVNPYSELSYGMNSDEDPALEGLDPLLVPHVVEMKLNEAGFRERSLSELVRCTGCEVTLVVGDSFGAGQGVRQKDRLTEVLENRLNTGSPSRRQLLVNFCMLGYNIRSIAETLERHLHSFPQVRRVIYLYNLNDAAHDARALEMSQSIDDFMHYRGNLLAESVDDSIISHSHAMRWILQRLARKRITDRTIEWYNYMYTDNFGWRATKKRLDQMRLQCEQEDSEFIIVLFPMLFELDDYPLRDAHVALETYAREAGIPFVDLLELFEGRDERDYWVHPRDHHPNHRAHAEAAGYLYETIDWQR